MNYDERRRSMGRLLGRVDEIKTPGKRGGSRVQELGTKAWSLNVQLQQVLPDLIDMQDEMTKENYADVRALNKAVDRADGVLTAIKSGYAMREDVKGWGRIAEAKAMVDVGTWTDKQKQRAMDEIEKQAGGVTPTDVRQDDESEYTAYFPKSDKGELATYRLVEAYKGAARRGFSTNMGMFYATIKHR